MKRLFKGLVLVGAIATISVSALPNTALAAKATEFEETTIMPRSSTYEVSGFIL